MRPLAPDTCLLLDSFSAFGPARLGRKPNRKHRNRTVKATGRFKLTVAVVGCLMMVQVSARAQPATFAADAQHTAQYSPPAQQLNRILWSFPVDYRNTGAGAHYGAPVITTSNTVIVPIRPSASGFRLSAFEAATGRLKYNLTTDYVSPPAGWLPVYQPVLVTSDAGTRLYYPGAGGTVYYIENPDSDTPAPPVQQCFYASLTEYSNNATAFNNRVFVNTPITAGSNGAVFFGFRIHTNGAPPPLNTTQGGFARIDAAGNATYVLAGTAANDAQISRDSHSCAPALSHDGATLYVPVKGTNAYYSYLLGLDSETLATKYKVLLRDPRNNNFAGVLDDATASPTIGPDGDVFFGVGANPGNGSRGFLLHFSADLATRKPPGGFGWDYTPAIVPTNMVPGYNGTSPYLLFGKYNNYAGTGDGDGINKLALLDPGATQIDPHPSANGLLVMRELMTVVGCTPDSEYQGVNFPFAVREWCINTAAVNPAKNGVFAPCEDGQVYCWDLASDSLSEALRIGPGVGQPYVPTAIGPDGTLYTLNGGRFFALGSWTNLSIAIHSSKPDLRTVVAGDSLTFTAVVTNLNPGDPMPTGTVRFHDVTYQGLTTVSNVLALSVPLTNGVAAITTSNLTAGPNQLGNHWITATYSGDSNYTTGSATLVQKVHASATLTTVTSSVPGPGSNSVRFTATVTSTPPGGGTPTGMVSFWDRGTFLGQVALATNGMATWTVTSFPTTNHAVGARYHSDTRFAASSGTVAGAAPFGTTIETLADGAVRLAFTNSSGAPFRVMAGTDLAVPSDNWIELGRAEEVFPGQFQFIDLEATNNIHRFYRLLSP